MTMIKRWTTSIVASVDGILGEFENHEALVNQAIREASASHAQAQVRFRRVHKDGDAMRKRLSEMQEQESLWRNRAKETALQNETTALECLRRAKLLQRRISSLEEEEREHTKLQSQLKNDLSKVQDQLALLREQRNMYRTRQSRAKALKDIQGWDSSPLADIEDIFDRWDVKLTGYEYTSGCQLETTDVLEEQFETQEETRDLKAELKSLLAEESNSPEVKL